LRKRVIVVAALGRVPRQMVPTHAAFGAPGVWRVGRSLPPTKSVAEALADVRIAADDPLSELRWPTGLEAKRIRALKPGQTMRDLPDRLQHASWASRANRRVRDGIPTQKRGGAPIGLRRLVPAEPSRAITGAAIREFVHPTEDRTLTLREAAILQTFPPAFKFVGSRGDVSTLIGNAIPPLFAKALAGCVAKTLASPLRDDARAGIARFHLTNADAMSPALKAVSDMILSRYPHLPQAQEYLL
jgi:DNA (cytosine-5)-methyltransferase 1